MVPNLQINFIRVCTYRKKYSIIGLGTIPRAFTGALGTYPLQIRGDITVFKIVNSTLEYAFVEEKVPHPNLTSSGEACMVALKLKTPKVTT